MTRSSDEPEDRPRSGGLPDHVRERLRDALTPGALQAAIHDAERPWQDDVGVELAGRWLSAALEGEMTLHLGYSRGEVPPPAVAEDNARNGHTVKTVATPLGDAVVRTPRDREASFSPRLVAKRQTRVTRLDGRVVGAYAGGATERDVRPHLVEAYGAEAPGGRALTTIVGALLEDVRAWRLRRLTRVYPILHLETIGVRTHRDPNVRPRPCGLAVGITPDGTSEVLGLWWLTSDGAAFWHGVLGELRRRGVQGVVLCRASGHAEVHEAVEVACPDAWLQTRGPVGGRSVPRRPSSSRP